jgi:2-polyprenyl-3-methyl-5-hydroxy-6-metoxy-1,4-benzoquinol methylase
MVIKSKSGKGLSVPSIEENITLWGSSSSWKHAGNEWSESWGSPEAQWNATVFPRIQKFLPADSALEIAPGFGRWTEFLHPHCEHLVGVDLNPNCIDGCRSRFAANPKLTFHQNDGRSLASVPDASIDFIFSFDSLVHVEADTLEAYLSQFRRIMRPDAVAFLHHSNFGAHLENPFLSTMNQVRGVRWLAHQSGLLKRNRHWRAETVSASTVRALCERHGLRCVRQEIIVWGGDVLNDCFSTIALAGSTASECDIVVNRGFMVEAAEAKKASPNGPA